MHPDKFRMGSTIQALTQTLQHSELQAFGLAMPRLAPDWSPTGATNHGFTVDEATMTMTSSANWAAPLDMSFQLINPGGGAPFSVTLVQPDGTAETAGGVLLTLFEQQWLRLVQAWEISRGFGMASPPALPRRFHSRLIRRIPMGEILMKQLPNLSQRLALPPVFDRKHSAECVTTQMTCSRKRL
jgi:hypothetical protein